jgi:lipoprotein-anchoring transpeptidase ErfK/SrfK
MRMVSLIWLGVLFLSLAGLVVGCADALDNSDPELGTGEGVDYDADNPYAPLDDGKSDLPRYMIPSDIPTLIAPEIIVSLDGLTVHLFDRATGLQAVYPAGVGMKNSRGVSITPTGHFKTGANGNDSWWYAPRRTVPDYFGGFPFMRLTARNSAGQNTYALHGPITNQLVRGYVSHGCVRMRGDDIVRLFWMVKSHPNTPVTFQREVELDAAGQKVDVGTTPVLYAPGEAIRFGVSVGARPW